MKRPLPDSLESLVGHPVEVLTTTGTRVLSTLARLEPDFIAVGPRSESKSASGVIKRWSRERVLFANEIRSIMPLQEAK